MLLAFPLNAKRSAAISFRMLPSAAADTREKKKRSFAAEILQHLDFLTHNENVPADFDGSRDARGQRGENARLASTYQVLKLTQVNLRTPRFMLCLVNEVWGGSGGRCVRSHSFDN